MKKILFLLLLSVSIYGQTYQNPTFGTVTTKTSPTVTNDPYLTTTGTTGIQGKIAPVNVLIPYTPINYTISGQTIGQQIAAIDAKIGTMGTTSAGVTQRVYFTADNTTVNSVVYFASSLSGKGSTASGSPPSLVLADNTKAFFTKDVISIAQPSPTIGYAGTYSGNLTVSATPTPVATQQRFTVEIYRTDNLGVPIASGVSGAPVGDLGVTVLAILDSGIINLAAGAITNIAVSGVLTQNITLNTGERLRYHVSAAKIGTGGGNVTFGVYYGTSYNSYYDVPVAITTDAVLNKSAVTGVTATDALNALNAKIPVNYSKIVYVDNNNPNSATIFDLNNPPATNDNSLKADVNNLYVGLDASGWVYNSTSLTYVTKTVTSATSNFYLAGTTTDAGNTKTGAVTRPGTFSGLFGLTENPIGTTINRIGQKMSNTDSWAIYGDAASSDLGIMVFEVGDNSVPGINSQRFEFRYKSPSGVGDITPFTINYDGISSIVPITATSFIKSGGLSTESLLANGGVLSNPVSGTGTTNFISKWSATGVQVNSRLFDNGTNFVGINYITPFLTTMGQSFGLSSTGSNQASTIELIGTTSTDGNILGRIIFGNTTAALPSAVLSVSKEAGNNSYGDLHFDVRGSGGYISNAFKIASTGLLSTAIAPTTSAGTYDILTRNTVTGVVEKIPSSTLASSGVYAPAATNIVNMGTIITDAVWSRAGTVYTVRVRLNIASFSVAGTISTFMINLPASKTTSNVVYVGTGVLRSVTDIYPVLVETAANTTQATVTIKPPTTAGSNGDIIFVYSTTE